MKILVLDQATQLTGYSVFEDSNLIKWGVLDVHKEKDAQVRVSQMCMEIYSLILTTKPDVVVMEEVSMRNSVKTLITLARMQGSIMQMCFCTNLNFTIYAATQWRKVVGIKQSSAIKRQALKEQAVELVKDSYGLSVSDDCAEAICIGLCHLKLTGVLPELKKIRKAAASSGAN